LQINNQAVKEEEGEQAHHHHHHHPYVSNIKIKLLENSSSGSSSSWQLPVATGLGSCILSSFGFCFWAPSSQQNLWVLRRRAAIWLQWIKCYSKRHSKR
jgi:hypothetical protein